jgi:hypothetical protein
MRRLPILADFPPLSPRAENSAPAGRWERTGGMAGAARSGIIAADT